MLCCSSRHDFGNRIPVETYFMRLAELKKLAFNDARDYYSVGKITRFEMLFRDYLNQEIDWPHYAPEDVIALREKLNLTQEALAVLLRVSPKTVLRWETKGEEIPSTACIALCILDKLGDGVFDLMRDDAGSYTLIESLKEQKSDLTAGINDSLYNLSLRDKQILPEPFDKAAVQELRSRLRMSRRELADLLEVSPSTVDKWESGAVTPKGPSLTVIKILWLKGKEALPK